MKVVKSIIGLLYKLNRFFPETILSTLYTLLIHPYLLCGVEAGMEHIKTIPRKSLFSSSKPHVQ